VVAGIGCISAFLTLYGNLKPSGRFEVVSHPEIFDGVRVKKGQAIAVIRANAASILSTERVILNLMQRMSGIATLTNEFVRAVAPANSKAKSKTKITTKILDTRKTIPGLRTLDKYAVCCGGGLNHRLDLQDGILIKNNHISLGGGLPAVLARALARRQPGQIVQVEVRTPVELEQAIAGGADSILLDNMTPKEVAKALKLIRKGLPKATVEASGNMSLKNVADYARTGVDFISVGALTHSATAVDLSMKITADLL
jgi:nicotinate-nucleotide pyrophosphorylase (carboxylating)